MLRAHTVTISVRATALFAYNFTGRVPANTLLLISSGPVAPRNIGATTDSGGIARSFTSIRIRVKVRTLQLVVKGQRAIGRLGFSCWGGERA